MLRSLLAFLLFALVISSAKGQTTTYSQGGLVVDVFLSNPCEGSSNGYIEFRVISTSDNLPAQLQVIIGPPNFFGPQFIPVGGTFRFNPAESLPPTNILVDPGYEFIIADNTGTDVINTFGTPTALTALPDIIVTDDPSLDLTNSSCTTPDGKIAVSIAGGSKILAGGGSFTYTWTTTNSLPGFPLTGTTDGTTVLDLATLAGLAGLPGGDYTLVIDDNFSKCSDTRNWTISDPQPSLQAITNGGPQAVCFGSNATINLGGSEAGVIYEVLVNGVFSGVSAVGTGAPLVISVPAGTFATGQTLVVRAVLGSCSPRIMTGFITMTVNPLPTVSSATGGGTVCSADPLPNVTFTFTGALNFNFTYFNGTTSTNVVNHGSTTFTIPNAPAGTYSITSLTGGNGCVATSLGGTVSVIVNPSPTSAVLGGTSAMCTGGAANLSVAITGGTGPFTININNGVGIINNYVSGTPIPVSPAATTTYSMVGNVTDANGCTVAGSGSATITVNTPPVSAVLSGTATVCSGTITNLIVTITGGTSPYTVQIDNGVGTINNYVSGTPIPVSPGATTTYSIVGNVTDAAGCSVAGSGSAIVTVNPSPTSAVLSGTAALCAGGSTNLIVTITGGTSPYTININNGIGVINNYVSGTPIPVSPGVTTMYSMVGNVTDALGCSVAGSGSATITVNTPPVSAVISGTATICSGTSTNLIVTITGGTSPYTVTINNGVGTINNYVSGTPIPVSPAATTTYNIVGNVTDAAGCSVAGSGSAIVTVNPSPTSAVLSGTATLCAGGSTNLVVTITGGTSPYTININNGVGVINNYVSGTPIPVSPGVTTTYNMVGNVTDAAGCTVAGSGTATVTVNTPPASAVISGTATICSGTSTNLIITITGGTSPYTVTINNGVGTINNYVSGTPIPVSPAATTTYSVVGNVTDAVGCSVAGSGSATVTVNPSPTSAVLSGTAAICSGSSTNLIVTITGGTSPYTININNGVGVINNYVSGTPIPVSPGATTTYNLVGNVTDASGCSVAGSGSATVTVNTPPASAVLSGTATICSGTSTNLIVTITGGTSPYTVAIDNGVGTINNYVSGTPIPVSPAATTTYNVVGNVTDAAGCSVAGSGSAIVTVNPSPTSAVLSGTATICSGTSTNLIVTITGGTSPYTVTINNGVGTINNYVSGTPIPVSPVATTTYSIVGNVTDASGCGVAGAGTATVTVNTPPASAVLSGTTTICTAGSANLIVTITGGTSPYTINIDNGVGVINNYVSGTPIPVSPGATTTYNMVGNVTDAAGCSVAGSGTATVTVNTGPVSAVLSGTATICTGGTTNLIVTITGGTSPYTVTINNGVGTINNYVSGTPISVSPAATTTYSIVGNVTDAAGCSVAGSGSAVVTVNSPTSAVLSGTATICGGNSTNLVVTVTGGTGPFTISIDNGVGVINNYVSGTPIPVSPVATTTYSMVGNVTDANGCTVAGSGTAVVTVNTPPLSAVLSGTATICSGTSTALIITITGGTGPYTVTLDNGIGTINNYVSGTPISISPAATTTYNIVGNVTDAAGCSVAGSGSAVVTVNLSPTSATLSGTTTICTGGTANLVVTITGGTSPYTINIDNGVGVINNYISGTPIPVSPAATTTYNLVGNITDANTCGVGGSGIATVVVNTPPVSAILSGDATICSGTSTDLIVTITGGTGPYTFTIDNGVGTINNYTSGTAIPVSPIATTTYSITGNITDAAGCTVAGTGTATVTVNPSPTSAVISGTATICSGISTNLSVTITGGTSPYTITVNNGIGTIANYLSGTPIPVTPGATTTYNLVGNVTDASGCTVAGSGSAVVTVNPSPTGTISGTTTICSGSSTNITINFTGTGPWNFQFSDGTTTSPVIPSFFNSITFPVNPTTTTTYTLVSVNDATACPGILNGSPVVTVNQNPLANLAVGVTIDPVCTGGISDVTVAGSEIGISYQLRDDSNDSPIGTPVVGTGGTINLTTGPLAATTTFNVLATSAGCAPVELTNKATVNVTGTINAALAVAAIANPICSGTSTDIQITASENGVLYQLRNDFDDSLVGAAVAGTGGNILLPTGVLSANTTFNVLASNGTCSIELTDVETVNVDIAPDPALVVGASPNPLCVGGIASVTVDLSEVGVSYQLRNEADDSSVGAAVAGTGGTISLSTGALAATTTFNILATSGGACGSTELVNLVTVNVSGTIDATLAVTAVATPICEGSSTDIQVVNSEVGVNYQLRNNANDANIGAAVAGTGGIILLPTGNLVATTSFNVLASNVTCSIELTDIETVNVDVAPDASLVVNALPNPLCTGGTASVTVALSEVGVSYQLRNDADDSLIGAAVVGTGGTISLSTGPLAATTSFNILATGGASCPAAELTTVVTVTVAGTIDNTLAVTSSAGTICSGFSTFIQVAASEVGVSYQLRNNANDANIGVAVAGTGGMINLPTGNLTATMTFNVLASNVTCSIELTDIETVTVNPAPATTLAVAPAAGLICPSTATSIIVTASELGVSYQLRNNVGNVAIGPPVVGTGGNISLPTGSLVANTTFNVFATIGTCSAQLTATASVTVRAVGDPACGGGGVNCGAFTVSIDDTRPSCSSQDDGSMLFTITGGTGFYVVTLYDSLTNPGVPFTKALPGNNTSVISFTDLNPSLNYFYKINDGINTCTLPFGLPLQSVVNATADASSFVDVSCFGQPVGQAIINASGSQTGQYFYSIDGTAWTQFIPGNLISNLPPNGTYNLLVGESTTDACTDTVQVVINNLNPAITATFAVTDATCDGNDGAITNIIAAGGQGGPYEFSLDGINFQNTNSFTDRPGGVDTLRVRDGAGCVRELPFSITFPGFVNFTTIKQNADCSNNGMSGSITVDITDVGSFRVALSTDQFNEPDDSEYLTYNEPFVTFENLNLGQYFIYVKSNSATCPSRSAPITITGVQAITFDFEYGCDPGTTPNVDKPYLKITNLVIKQNIPISVTIFKGGILATPTPITILVPSGANAVVFDYDTYVFMQTPGDDYEMVVTQVDDIFFCEVVSQRVPFVVPRRLSAFVGTLTESYPDIPTGTMQVRNFDGGMFPYDIRIELDSASSFELPSYETNYEEVLVNSNSQFEKIYKNLPAGRYLVQVRDTVGCFIQRIARVPLDTDIFIPNIFTPNEDGSNDVFFVRNLPTSAKLIITNRWGKEVYSTNDYQNDWKADGVSDGIYFYRLQGSDASPVSGWIEVLRGPKP